MTEVWFYHLQRQPVARALPALLDKALERGWRIVLQAEDQALLDKLDELLWTYAPESFVPHGQAKDGDAERQAVFLTTGTENPNGAAMRLFVGKTAPGEALGTAAYERAILLFDGNDESELTHARAQWKVLKDGGSPLAYWQQTERGWERKM